MFLWVCGKPEGKASLGSAINKFYHFGSILIRDRRASTRAACSLLLNLGMPQAPTRTWVQARHVSGFLPAFLTKDKGRERGRGGLALTSGMQAVAVARSHVILPRPTLLTFPHFFCVIDDA